MAARCYMMGPVAGRRQTAHQGGEVFMNPSKRPVARPMTVSAGDLHRFTVEVLGAAGMPAADAELAARVIVDASLRGVDTHGVFLLGRYVHRMRLGLINHAPRMHFERRRAAIGVLDADH